ncbi:MAG: methionyl-tRNA formyltransferase [Candidatus Levybacteria bacterium]|nr:methionyl-tRNA formyltransferase [Candidatus Levybacteria bacterium]
MNKKIIFFGSGWYTIPVVEKLLTHGLDLVVTTEKDPSSPFLKFCKANNLQTLSVSSANDLINHESLIINHSFAVLASFGAIIPQVLIDNLPNGIINIHPSLLPKYKGPSPIQYALLNGETITGVTLIKLDDQIDHGPILAQKPYNLIGNETTEDLLSILFEIGGEMVEEIVTKLENNETVIETPQEHSKESWSYKLEKNSGYIDIASPEFKISNLKFKINDMIRAFYPWPGVWFVCHRALLDHPELVSGSSKLDNKTIKLLPEGRIQVEGKKPMAYKDFINGFGEEGKELLEKIHLI